MTPASRGRLGVIVNSPGEPAQGSAAFGWERPGWVGKGEVTVGAPRIATGEAENQCWGAERRPRWGRFDPHRSPPKETLLGRGRTGF